MERLYNNTGRIYLEMYDIDDRVLKVYLNCDTKVFEIEDKSERILFIANDYKTILNFLDIAKDLIINDLLDGDIANEE